VAVVPVRPAAATEPWFQYCDGSLGGLRWLHAVSQPWCRPSELQSGAGAAAVCLIR
jgi:hypothetical protein